MVATPFVIMNTPNELIAFGMQEVIDLAGVNLLIKNQNFKGILSDEVKDANMDSRGFVVTNILRTFVTLRTSTLIQQGFLEKSVKASYDGKHYQIDSISQDANTITLTLKAV